MGSAQYKDFGIMKKQRPLSDRQKGMLKYIWTYSKENGRPPTIREIGKAVNISSTSVVNYNLTKLTEKGLLERDAEVSRGLRLTETALAMYETVRETVDEAATAVAAAAKSLLQVPLVGTIAAGKPIDLPATDYGIYDEDDMVELSRAMLNGRSEGLFALRVKGDSMIDAMVNDNDIVIMREQSTAENGEMVAVWLKNDDTTTLKYFSREGTQVKLTPANPTMKPFYVDAQDVSVQGRVMMVLRQTA